MVASCCLKSRKILQGALPRWPQQWTPVKPVDGVITCNIGDMLMRWSDEQLPSNFHRVRNPLPPGDVHVLRHARETQAAVLVFASELERWARHLPSMSSIRPTRAKPAMKR